MAKLFLKFQGFYESSHSSEIDTYIESEESYFLDEHENKEEIKKYLKENSLQFWEVVDYKETYKKYSKLFLESFECFLLEEFGLKLDLKFIGLDSPKYYNYSTDKIEFQVKIKKSKINELLFDNENDITEIVENEIKHTTTSKDGYIPYYTFKEIRFENKDNSLKSCFFDSLVEYFENDFYFCDSIHEIVCESIVYKKDFEKLLSE